MTVLALSPHLDDAVFSAGARLADVQQKGGQSLVLTLFAGDPSRIPPLAGELHRQWRLDDDAVETRRREDRAACLELGARAEHWPLQDAIYRESLPDDPRIAQTWLFRMFADPRWVDDCTDRLRRVAERESWEQVLLPLGIGGHVDHRITRAAGERAFPPELLLYYEDYPYRRRHRKRWRALWPPGRLRSAHLTVTEPLLAAKCRAVRCYRSQLRSLAPADAIDAKLERDFDRFERFWRLRPGRRPPARAN
ncbi:MAG: PIG-L family deacetylase [Acidobacteria bacterium]|nr:MAG: PIG-L family deacetylase [Acidobacteriota bacterium]REK07348.1 MAG: PIG-L family deacetylase [Acidobacteriota bacterium]